MAKKKPATRKTMSSPSDMVSHSTPKAPKPPRRPQWAWPLPRPVSDPPPVRRWPDEFITTKQSAETESR